MWPGIDLVYSGKADRLEYDFVVAPGSDPSAISVTIEGADRVAPSADGGLVAFAGRAELRQSKPLLYQLVGGARRTVTGDFVLGDGHRFGFRVGPYDRSLPLVIDPVLGYSTHLGGLLGDSVTAVAVDASGNAYVTGSTASANFPTAGALQAQSGGQGDAFVAKLNAAGTALVWSTYLGGSLADDGAGIAVDASGGVVVVGSTTSSNFPVTRPFQASKGAGTTSDAFVARLDLTAADAASSPYSTYLGGGADDIGNAVAVDGQGRAYVTGETRSPNFPTVAPMKATISGACPTTNEPARQCREAYVAKLDPSRPGPASVVYATFLGGTSSTWALEHGETGLGIDVDDAGRAYVVGETSSDDFPVVSAVQPARAGDQDAFVVKLNASGSALDYSTYLGGAATDRATGVAVDQAGSAHIVGTGSASFPRVDPLAPVASVGDAVVAQLAPAGSSLTHSTHLGGNAGDTGLAIALDGSGDAYVGGSTFSGNFPTANALQTAPAGAGDGFVARIGPSPTTGPLITRLAPRSGPPAGSTTVVITGSGFTGATAVRFGGAAATSFRVDSPTQITAVSPAGDGTVAVEVTTSTGTFPGAPVAA